MLKQILKLFVGLFSFLFSDVFSYFLSNHFSIFENKKGKTILRYANTISGSDFIVPVLPAPVTRRSWPVVLVEGLRLVHTESNNGDNVTRNVAV